MAILGASLSTAPSRSTHPAARRVLVVSGSAGHGHVMAARAVVAALRERHPTLTVAHIDAVARMWTPYKQIYRAGYVQLVDRHPGLWRHLYETTNTKHSGVGHALSVLAGGRFVGWVQRWRPDLILCTHFLAPELLARPLRKGRITAELHVVVTDHDIHRSWVWPGIRHFYTASDLVKARLALTYGIDESAITVTGIPVRKMFSEDADPRPVYIRYGLDPNRPVVLFLSGGFAAGPMGRSILGLWKDRRDVQILAVCGRNEHLRRRIARLPRPDAATLHALGFVENVRDLMAVADVVIAKSGGITTSECMAVGRPMIISGSIPGQEERNADAVIEAGAGYRALTPEEVRFRVRLLLLDDEDLRAGVARRAERFGRPQAAAAIADRIAHRLQPEQLPTGPRFHGAV